MLSTRKRRLTLPQADDHLDLVPLIDCVFLLLLFFMLCGRLSTDNRTEQVTVPPTKTAMKQPVIMGWGREVINVFGSTQSGDPPRNTIWLGKHKFSSPEQTLEQKGIDNYRGYIELRKVFDKIYDHAEKYPDPNPLVSDDQKMQLPKVVVEIRADGDTEFRVVQEIQQILADVVDPKTMQPKRATPAQMKSFVNLEFTTRSSSDLR